MQCMSWPHGLLVQLGQHSEQLFHQNAGLDREHACVYSKCHQVLSKGKKNPTEHAGCRPDVRRAAGNLPWVDVLPQEGMNVYSILQRDQLVLTKPALEAAVERLRRPIVIRRIG